MSSILRAVFENLFPCCFPSFLEENGDNPLTDAPETFVDNESAVTAGSRAGFGSQRPSEDVVVIDTFRMSEPDLPEFVCSFLDMTPPVLDLTEPEADHTFELQEFWEVKTRPRAYSEPAPRLSGLSGILAALDKEFKSDIELRTDMTPPVLDLTEPEADMEEVEDGRPESELPLQEEVVDWAVQGGSAGAGKAA